MSSHVGNVPPATARRDDLGDTVSAAVCQSQDRDAHLALALDAGAMGTWTWNIATDAVTWSPSVEVIHGRASGNSGGTLAAFLALVPANEREGVGAAIRNAPVSGDSFRVTYRTVWPNGETHSIEGRGRVLRDAHGAPTSIAGIVHDVTESRAATDALRVSEERYRVLTEVSPQIVWSADKQGAITFVNQSWQTYSGLTVAQSLGAGWLDAVEPDHRERVAALWRVSVETGADFDVQIPFREAAGGTYRWHIARGRQLHDAAGMPTGWVGTALDIHDHRILEAEREQLLTAERTARQIAEDAVKMRDTFLSVAAHELNTPLTTLRGNIQLLQRRYERGQLDPARFMRSFAALDAATVRLSGLVRELLDVSRLHTGNFTLNPGPLDLVAFVTEALAESLVLLDQHHTLATVLPDVPIPVHGDASRLTQVLANLLSNAVKYAPDGGEITVSVVHAPKPVVETATAAVPPAAPEAGVTVQVRDRGIGLPPGSAEEIFTPFTRAANAVRGQLPGLGLGLFISRGIVAAHGGYMWAESPGEGLGTTVTFWLPVVASV